MSTPLIYLQLRRELILGAKAGHSIGRGLLYYTFQNTGNITEPSELWPDKKKIVSYSVKNVPGLGMLAGSN